MLSNDILREYKRLRAESPVMGSKVALSVARYNTRPLRWDWRTFAGGHVATTRFQQDGFDIRVEVDDELSPQSTVTPTDENTGIRNPDFDYDRNPYGSRWLSLESDYTVDQLTEDWNGRPYGMSKSVARAEARKSLNAEASDIIGNDVQEFVITVTAYFEGIEVGSDSLGGVSAYVFRDLEREMEGCIAENSMVEQALDEARDQLTAVDAKIHASGLLTATA